MALSQVKRRQAAEANSLESLSGAGAIDPKVPTSRINSTGVGTAYTLAAGQYKGQRKRIIHKVDGGTAVITPSAMTDSLTTVTLTAVWDWVDLEWNGTAWAPIGHTGATFA